MEKTKIKKKILINKYNCISKDNRFERCRKVMHKNIKNFNGEEQQYAMINYTNDYLYNVFVFEILIKRLIRDGKLYEVRKQFLNGLKLFKKVSRKDPILFYIFLLNYYMISIGFTVKVKSGRPFIVPANIWSSEEEEYSATIKLFKKALKTKNKKNLALKVFFELLALNSFPKKSIFYNNVLENYYDKIIDNFQNIGMK